uniref:26S proteasome complex subunit SEM1 n=1 Tax=Oryza barthii TaxID=65489 RepID=A0A0D3EN37_9ORYZ
MADTAKADAAAEAAKMDLLEDDDEFEEFEIDQGMHRSHMKNEWDDKEEGNEAVQQWEDDWDDDDVNDDFSLQLRKELESIPSKN